LLSTFQKFSDLTAYGLFLVLTSCQQSVQTLRGHVQLPIAKAAPENVHNLFPPPSSSAGTLHVRVLSQLLMHHTHGASWGPLAGETTLGFTPPGYDGTSWVNALASGVSRPGGAQQEDFKAWGGQ